MVLLTPGGVVLVRGTGVLQIVGSVGDSSWPEGIIVIIIIKIITIISFVIIPRKILATFMIIINIDIYMLSLPITSRFAVTISILFHLFHFFKCQQVN